MTMRRLVLDLRMKKRTHAIYERDGEFSRTLCGKYFRGGEVDHKPLITCAGCAFQMQRMKVLCHDEEPARERQLKPLARTRTRTRS